MADNSNKIEVRLSTGNYSEWRVKFLSLLILKDLQEVLDQEIQQDPSQLPNIPPTEQNAAATRERAALIESYRSWYKQSIKVRALIELNVDKHNSERIRRLAHSRSAWEALERYHNSGSVGNLQRLQEKIINQKIRSGITMEQHLDDLFGLFMRYREAGAEYSDDQMVQQILTSVRPLHCNIVDSISASTDKFDPWKLRMWLIDYVQDDDNQSELAFATKHEVRRNQGNKETRLKNDVRENDCFGASDTETEREVKSRIRNQPYKVEAKSSNPYANYICNGCKQKGHIRVQCNAATMSISQIERLLLLKKEGNKANAASSSQSYANCFLISSLSNDWIIDSGATAHMTPNAGMFSQLDRSHRSQVVVADGKVLKAIGVGSVRIKLTNDDDANNLILEKVLFVPDLKSNLFSIREFTVGDKAVTFDANKVYLLSNNKKLLIGRLLDNHYRIYGSEQAMLTSQIPCKHEWHRRFAHRNLQDISHMISLGLPSRQCSCSNVCEDCLTGKMARRPFKPATPVANVLDVIVSDVHGPMPVESMSKKRYFVTFIDVKSRYCEIMFIRQKSDVTSCTIQYIERLKNQFGKKPKVFRSDRGMEYLDQRLQNYFLQEGIWFESTVGYCPQQNGIAERMNRTLGEGALTLLSDSNLPKNHWAEAVAHTAYTLNRVVKRKATKSPLQMFCGEKPDWDSIRRFGSDVYVHVPEQKRNKLQPKSIKMKFVGFDLHAKGYRVSDGQKVILSREVKFIEGDTDKRKDKVTHQQNNNDEEIVTIIDKNDLDLHDDLVDPNVNNNQLEPIPDHDQDEDRNINDMDSDQEASDGEIVDDEQFDSANSHNEDEEDEIPEIPPVQEEPEQLQLRRSNRTTAGKLPSRYSDFVVDRALVVTDDPKTYKEAVNSINAENWKKAMQQELSSIEKNQTWTVVELPTDRKAVGSKWVFKTKLTVDGEKQFKARLVAQGFSQQFGVDYDEVFAPVANSTTFKVLLTVAGMKGFHAKHYDVKSAFLNGSLQEEIYMKPPPGVNENGKVYRLNKSLYGLKQAAHVWNQKLHETLISHGCVQSKEDDCLYSHTSGGEVTYLLVHVDDILSVTSSPTNAQMLMNQVGKVFEIKDLGEARSYLGISLERNRNGFFEISQSDYIQKILEATGMLEAKVSRIPMAVGYHKLKGVPLKTNEEYRKIIGMLLYLSVNTRPDIAAAVAILCQKVSSPRDVDFIEVKRVLRYLKGTQFIRLTLGSAKKDIINSVQAYSDSDWAEDTFDRKSNSGILCLVNNAAVIWKSKKQTIVATSSAEAEYIALSQTVKELIWLKRLSESFGIKQQQAMKVYTDSQSAIAMITKPKMGSRTKHIDTKYHHVKDAVNTGVIELQYVPTERNIADVLTKPLGKNKIKRFRELLGLTSSSEIEEEC